MVQRLRNCAFREEIFVSEQIIKRCKNLGYCTSKEEKKESETLIKCIPLDEIPVESPSPMHFCAFGLLKRALEKRHSRTLNGLQKMVQEE
ncbi:hypothetical protein TNCV_3838651 [Trichonephila clavipes]|nr:hypothetical protein TNCV_3838651 [Trichonephila clavipes]